jgi:hypothetical protein
MIRNLKAFGLALVVMAALGSLVASGAQAAPTFDTNAGAGVEWHPTGTEINGDHTYTLPLGTLSCEESHFDPTETYKDSVTKVKVTPTYNKCHATTPAGTFPVTVTHNGCEFEFHAKEREKEPTTTYTGTAAVVCPPGVNGIEIHVFNDVKHENLRCTFTVKPQSIKGNILTHNEATDVTLTANTVETAVEKTSGSLLQCGGSTPTAVYHGDATVTATNNLGESVKATIAGE